MTAQPSNAFNTPKPVAQVITEFVRKVSHRVPAASLGFEQKFGTCAMHGDYPINHQDADGTVRWRQNICAACQRQENAKRLLQRAEIAPRFAKCTFDNYVDTDEKQRHALNVCRDYADNFAEHYVNGTCLILRGEPGTGKNHLATAITKAVLALGYTALHATAYELVVRIRETWRKTDKTERNIIQELGKIDLLVIDEIGRQYRSEGEQLHLFQIIDERYRLMRPTIIISNKTRDEIRQCLGDAAYDRLTEGGGQLINFDWPSQRAQLPKKGEV